MPKLKTIEVWECENCGAHLETEDTVCKCQPATNTEKRKYCSGCYNDEYNHGLGGAAQCWSMESMLVVQRKRVHINDRPPWNHPPEALPNCYRVPKFVFPSADQTC